MPTYVYKCDNDHTFEAVQSMSEEALDSCEICGAPARRQLFAPAVHFKGSGFYTTDYARKGAGTSSNGSGEKGSGEEKKAAEKPESKPKSEAGSASSSGGSSSGGSSSGSSSTGD